MRSLQRLDEIGFWLNIVGKGNLVFMQISLRRNLYTHQVGEVIALKWSNIFPFYINISKRVEDKNKYILT